MQGRYVQRRGVFQQAIAEGRYRGNYWGPEYGPVPTDRRFAQVPHAFRYNPLAFDQLSTGSPIRRAPVSGLPVGTVESASSAGARNLVSMYGDELYGRGNGIFEGRAVPCSSEPAEQQVQRGGIFDAATFAEDCVYDGSMRGRRVGVNVVDKRRYLENDSMKAKRIGFTPMAGADGLWGR